jgi:hypothetical protein
MLNKPATLLSFLAMLSATACVRDTTETVRAVSDYCLIAKPITYSEIHPGQTEDAGNVFDSAETVEQVKNHDLAYERVCGAK